VLALILPTGARRWLPDMWGRDASMDDQSARKPRKVRRDPSAEPDAGPGAAGSGFAASDKAQNAEIVFDPDLEPEDPAVEVGDQIDRIEGHSRPTRSPSQHESPPPPDTPPA
jgi:hypothetical protein